MTEKLNSLIDSWRESGKHAEQSDNFGVGSACKSVYDQCADQLEAVIESLDDNLVPENLKLLLSMSRHLEGVLHLPGPDHAEIIKKAVRLINESHAKYAGAQEALDDKPVYNPHTDRKGPRPGDEFHKGNTSFKGDMPETCPECRWHPCRCEDEDVEGDSSYFQHYKGGIYHILCQSRLESDKRETLITYADEKGNNWTRTTSEFFEILETGEPRFKSIPAPGSETLTDKEE